MTIIGKSKPIKQIYLIIVFSLTGCAFFAPNPHENFKTILNSQLGKKWNELPSYEFPSEEQLISSKTLPNGNVEKKYKMTWGFRGQRTCVDIYEIDPSTNIIVGVGFEGTETDCVINP